MHRVLLSTVAAVLANFMITLNAEQVAPYAPLEIKRTDLDSEPVASILEHLRTTGRLVLNGNPSVEQTSLF